MSGACVPLEWWRAEGGSHTGTPEVLVSHSADKTFANPCCLIPPTNVVLLFGRKKKQTLCKEKKSTHIEREARQYVSRSCCVP